MEWLKSLFKKKEEKTFKNITELEDYFSSKTSQVIEQESRINSNFKEDFKQKINELKELMGNLETAQLRNPDIEERIKDFMTGNRKNYLHQLNYFITNLPVFDEHKFGKKYSEAVKLFIEKTRKSDAVLKEFFSQELRDISLKLGELNKLVEKITHPSKEYEKVKSVFERIDLYKKYKNSVKELEKKDFGEIIIKEKNELKKFEKEKENLEKSKELAEYEKLRENLLEAQKLKHNVRNEVLNLFSPIMRVLKKYQRAAMNNAELIKDYLSSPEKTFVKDVENKILQILENAKKAHLNEKDKSRLEKVDKNLTREVLNKIRKKLLNHEEKEKKLSEEIAEREVKKTLNKLSEKISEKKNKISELEKEKTACENKLNELKKLSEELLAHIIKDVEQYCYIKVSLE